MDQACRFQDILFDLDNIRKLVKDLRDEVIRREFEKERDLDYETYGPDIQDMLDDYETESVPALSVCPVPAASSPRASASSSQ